jgi:hypothetical protein
VLPLLPATCYCSRESTTCCGSTGSLAHTHTHTHTCVCLPSAPLRVQDKQGRPLKTPSILPHINVGDIGRPITPNSFNSTPRDVAPSTMSLSGNKLTPRALARSLARLPLAGCDTGAALVCPGVRGSYVAHCTVDSGRAGLSSASSKPVPAGMQVGKLRLGGLGLCARALIRKWPAESNGLVLLLISIAQSAA